MTEPIFAAVERDIRHGWDAFTSHLHRRHYHDPSNPHTPEAPMSLLATVEADLAKIGHSIDQAAHDVLTRHLGLANIAAHVANETAVLAASPLAHVVETAAGLNASEQAFVARAAADAADWLSALSQPAAAAPAGVDPAMAAPAEPVAAQ